MTTSGQAWCLELTRDQVAVCRLARAGDAYTIDRYRAAALDGDWEQGPPPWRRAISELGLKGPLEPLVVCIGDELLLYRELSLPAADEATLGQMIAAQAESVLPQAGSLEWSWGPLASDGDVQRVLICALRADVRRAAWDVARELGEPGLLAPASVVLAMAYADAEHQSPPSFLLLDVERNHTTLLAVAGGRLAGCVTTDCGVEGAAHSPTSWAREMGDQYRASLAQLPGRYHPGRAVLAGTGAPSNEAVSAVEAALQMPVTPRRPPAPIVCAPGVSAPIGSAAVAGALLQLRGLRPAVTLSGGAPGSTPAPTAARPETRRKRRVALAATWALAALLGLYALDRYRAATIEAAVSQLRIASAEGGGLQRQAELGRYLTQTPTPPLPLLDELSTLIAPGVILTHLEFDGAGQLRLQGTLMGEGLEGLVKKMSDSPLLKSVTLRSATKNPQTQQWAFEIGAQVEPLFRYIAHKSTAPPAPAGGLAQPVAAQSTGASP